MASSESEPEFEVTEILKQRKRKGLVEYLVRWNGYNDSDDDSWEPASSLTNCTDQLKKFAQAQELAKKEKKRLSRARSKSRGRSGSRARSKSASRKTEKKKSVSKSEKSVSKSAKSEKSVSNNVSVTKEETSLPLLKSEGKSQVLSSDEEEDERLTSTRSRQSRRSEVITTSRTRQVRSDIVDGSMTKITRLLGERRETFENHRNTDLKVTKSPSKTGLLANMWNNMDTAVLILFVCITVIIFSFIMEKYISSDDICTSIANIYKRSSRNIQNWWKILCATIYNAWNSIVVFIQSNWKQVSKK